MTAFVVVAAAMLVVALAFLLVPLLTRAVAAVAVDRDASNLALLRDQVRELDADLAAGTLSPEQHEQSKRELEARVLEESVAAPGNGRDRAALRARSPPRCWGRRFRCSPSRLTSPGADSTRSRRTRAAARPRPPTASTTCRRRRSRKWSAGSPRGWSRSRATPKAGSCSRGRTTSMNRFPEAARAYERAVALLPGDADLLADYADALGATQNGLAGKPTQIIEQALKADPTQWKALALAGTAAFDRQGLRGRRRLLGAAEGDGAARRADREVDRRQHRRGALAGRTQGSGRRGDSAAAEDRRGGPAASTRDGAAGAGNATPASGAPLAGASVPGTIALSPALAAKAGPYGRRVRVRAPRRRFAGAARDPAQGSQGPAAQVHARRFAGDEPGHGDLQARRGHRRRAGVEVRQRRAAERRS